MKSIEKPNLKRAFDAKFKKTPTKALTLRHAEVSAELRKQIQSSPHS